MSDNELINELRGQRETIQEQLTTAQTQISEMTARITVLEQHEQTVQAIREMVGEGDMVQTIREMQTAFNEMQRVQRQQQVAEAVTAALGDIAQNERGAQLIREMVGPVESAEAAAARVKELLAKDYVQTMLRALVGEMAGPGAFVGGQGDGQTDWRQAIADQGEALARQYGLDAG